MKIKNFIFIVFLAVSVSFVRGFEPWDQVEDIWLGGMRDSFLNNPHFYRFVLVYPGFVLEDKLPGIGYSLYFSIFLIILYMTYIKLAGFYQGGKFDWLGLLVIFIITIIMNGRGVIAWAAWIMCINISHVDEDEILSNFWLVLVCLIFSSVSSGVFAVVALVISKSYIPKFVKILYSRKDRIFRKLVLPLVFLPVIYLSVEYLTLTMQKNIEFFDGSIFNILHHGSGSLLFIIDPFLLVVLLFFILTASLLVVYKYKSNFDFFNIIVPVIGGVFGFLVLTLIFPILLAKRVHQIRIG